ncbi:hypothetical protein GCM10010275_20180 [Streptomyces litmocidini]|nr:hypothetical protein GCM10010275_20180 [Streptomyces litmocidini]
MTGTGGEMPPPKGTVPAPRNDRAARASRAKRVRKPESPARAPCTTLGATVRPPRERPRETRPVPPSPNRWRTRYEPALRGSPSVDARIPHPREDAVVLPARATRAWPAASARHGDRALGSVPAEPARSPSGARPEGPPARRSVRRLPPGEAFLRVGRVAPSSSCPCGGKPVEIRR